MNHSEYLAFALPAFFLFLWLEYVVVKKKKLKNIYKYESSVSNISIGIAERLLNLFITVSFYNLYVWIYENYRLLDISNARWIWVVITVAARITTLQAIVRNVFWCILPFIGFHPNLVMTILVVHGVYSFFTHTQILEKQKWLEYIFITPSLHGVHHASDEKYLDKNYGDVFVFWDKLFGTFQKEEEKPRYGLTHPINSYSFLWQHFHYYLELYEAAHRKSSIKEKLTIYFGSPAVMDQEIRPIIEKKWMSKNKVNSYHFKYKGYINLQLILSFVAMSILTYYFDQFDNLTKGFFVAFVLITLINIGAQLEQKRWVPYLEHIRFLVFCSFFIIQSHNYFLLILPFIFVFIIEKMFNFSNWYQKSILKII